MTKILQRIKRVFRINVVREPEVCIHANRAQLLHTPAQGSKSFYIPDKWAACDF